MKKGLQKPEPVGKKDILLFIPDVQMEDVSDDFDFSTLTSPPSTKYEIDTKKPITKLVDKTHNILKVIPKLETTDKQEPVRAIHSPVLRIFNDKTVSSSVQKAFPNIKQKIMPEAIQQPEHSDALITEDDELQKKC